ncbi:MAG: cation transporter, partial [Alphaproteobacteria bacterium]
MTTTSLAAARELTPKPAADEGQELAFPVKGMTCAGCANHVAKKLRTLPGVLAAEVSFTLEKADLRVDPAKVDRDGLIAAVEELGYSVPLEDLPSKKEKAGTHHDPHAHHAAAPWQSVRLTASVLLTLPFAAHMVAGFAGLPFHVPPLVQMGLASLVQFVIGWHFYKASWTALRHGNGTMDQLVALGTSAAYGLSAYRVLSPEVQGADELYFEA